MEHVWHNNKKDWRRAKLITAGIDIGSTSSQALVMVDGEIVAHANFQSVSNETSIIPEVLSAALNSAGMVSTDIGYIVATGSGASDIQVARRTVSEIACHARGLNYCVGSIASVLVMGGQNCVAILCNDVGQIMRFLANACPASYCRKSPCLGCGAAQGKSIESVCDFLGIPIEEAGPLSLTVDDKQIQERLASTQGDLQGNLDEGDTLPLYATLSAVCDVLARSQAMGLQREGWSKAEILAAYFSGIAHQAALLVKRVGITEKVVVTGGVAKNTGVVRRLENELSVDVVTTDLDPQLTGALGAALFASDLLEKSVKTA